MLKQWELEYLLDLVEDETNRCLEMQNKGIKRDLHLKDLTELRKTLLNTEYDEGEA